MIEATVCIPTHCHGPTLFYSVRSALAQSVSAIEVFIIGDGVNQETREIVRQLMAEDARVRFFDLPKGPRLGEAYRHSILQNEARGAVIAYLCDDDLWLSTHLETLIKQLQEADFTHSLPLYIDAQGQVGLFPVDLSLAFFRDMLAAGTNRVPLSSAAHTRKAYLQLPHGWRTTPPSVPTDLYMWQQFLSHPELRFTSGTKPTAITFPSPQRLTWPLDERVRELETWTAKLRDPQEEWAFLHQIIDDYATRYAELERECFQCIERKIGDWVFRIPLMKTLRKWVAKVRSGRPSPRKNPHAHRVPKDQPTQRANES